MSQKKEFMHLAQREGANISRLCRYFQVSRKTAYKWLAPSTPKSVTYVSERLLPFSPVQTTGGEG
jgi:hypothetical protein